MLTKYLCCEFCYTAIIKKSLNLTNNVQEKGIQFNAKRYIEACRETVHLKRCQIRIISNLFKRNKLRSSLFKLLEMSILPEILWKIPTRQLLFDHKRNLQILPLTTKISSNLNPNLILKLFYTSTRSLLYVIDCIFCTNAEIKFPLNSLKRFVHMQ